MALEKIGPMDHLPDRWCDSEISFEIIDDLTDDPVVAVWVRCPAGVLAFMGEPEMLGNVMVVRQTHVQDSLRNVVGPATLRLLARVVMERMQLDELIIEGAVRTTGANPGRHPRPIRFRRHRSIASRRNGDRDSTD